MNLAFQGLFALACCTALDSSIVSTDSAGACPISGGAVLDMGEEVRARADGSPSVNEIEEHVRK